MARKPKPPLSSDQDDSRVAPGREAPPVDLSAAVAIERANALVNAPTPPAIQAVLDADPAAADEARASLARALAAAEDSQPQPAPGADTGPASQE